MLFLDYVRMLRKQRPEPSRLHPDDVRFLTERIDPMGWYPMASFERFGLVILRDIVGTETDAIRLWGRSRLEPMLATFPELLVAGDPVASVHRFHDFFKESFDFETVKLPHLEPGRAVLEVGYGMSAEAEEAAAWQTAGFFETIITSSGGRAVRSRRTSASPARFEVTWQADAVPEPHPAPRLKLLVVDDEALVLAAMRRILDKVGDVSTARSAEEAITLLEAQPFDGVLSDFNMPGHDGLWLMGELQRRWPHVRRVLQSADLPAEAETALKNGLVHELLEKPAALDVVRAAFVRR